jgi:hypothetical protein
MKEERIKIIVENIEEQSMEDRSDFLNDKHSSSYDSTNVSVGSERLFFSPLIN